jgi:hypothetical protein
MGELEVLLTHSLAENFSTAKPGDKGPKEGVDGFSTPKIKLIFNLLRGCDGLSPRKWEDANPFETLNTEDEASSFLIKASEALEGGWTFKGKKKHKIKIEPTRLTTNHPPHLDAPLGKILGENRGQKHSELHHSFFESLRILLPKRVEQGRAKIWLIFTRKKGPLKEILIH